ncbi:MAG TPA: hypothetical protein VG651_12885 [Stellaceae bacterium]|nr:hypothetical protein [Stellaceae bacterium]
MRRSSAGNKSLAPTGIERIDRWVPEQSCRIEDYLAAVSEYVRRSRMLTAGEKKSGQIRLSGMLGRALADELRGRLPHFRHAIVGERKVSGALRTVNADVSEIHPIDGLRLAIELKPVNLAVGRAIWNRFGDIRTFAVNLHLKFPFCVIGGVLVIPTYEEAGTPQAAAAEAAELAAANDAGPEAAPAPTVEAGVRRKDTRHLISRAVARLVRAGGRKTEADAAHLLEGIAVVVYDPDTGLLEPELPPKGSGLRWDEFIDALATAYEARFED